LLSTKAYPVAVSRQRKDHSQIVKLASSPLPSPPLEEERVSQLAPLLHGRDDFHVVRFYFQFRTTWKSSLPARGWHTLISG
jgi:hypothetical protein